MTATTFVTPEPSLPTVEPLRGDFARLAPDRLLDVFVGRIQNVHATATAEGAYTHTQGSFRIEVTETLAKHLLHPGDVILLGFAQTEGPPTKRQGEDRWDTIKVAEGSMLLLACRSADGGHTWQAVAGIGVEPRNTAAIESIRQMYHHEAGSGQARPGDDRLVVLGRALENPDPAQVQYALHALVERNEIGREQAVHLLSFALMSTAVSAENRYTIAGSLAELFQQSDLKDGARSNILGALAQAMVREKDKERQAMLAAYLRSCLMSRAAGDDQHRVALVRAVTAPPAEQVTGALTVLEHEDASLARMAQIWQAAKR